MTNPTSANQVAYGKIDEDVILTRVDSALSLSIMSVEKIDIFQRVIDQYLNIRSNKFSSLAVLWYT